MEVKGSMEKVSYSKFASRTWIMAVVWTAIFVAAIGVFAWIAIAGPAGAENIPLGEVLFASLIVVSWFMGKSLTKEIKRQMPAGFVELLDTADDVPEIGRVSAPQKTVPDDGKGA